MYELGMGMGIIPELNAVAAVWSFAWGLGLAASGLLFLGLMLLDPPADAPEDTDRAGGWREAA